SERFLGEMPSLSEFFGPNLVTSLYLVDALFKARLCIAGCFRCLIVKRLDLGLRLAIYFVDSRLGVVLGSFQSRLGTIHLRLQLCLRLASGLIELRLQLIDLSLPRSSIPLHLRIDNVNARSPIYGAAERLHARIERRDPILFDLSDDGSLTWCELL